VETAGVFTSAANTQGSTKVTVGSADTSLQGRFAWLVAPWSTPTRYFEQPSGEFTLFSEETREWAEASLPVCLECWPDDEWSDK
jgi:hypothetical protein